MNLPTMFIKCTKIIRANYHPCFQSSPPPCRCWLRVHRKTHNVQATTLPERLSGLSSDSSRTAPVRLLVRVTSTVETAAWLRSITWPRIVAVSGVCADEISPRNGKRVRIRKLDAYSDLLEESGKYESYKEDDTTVGSKNATSRAKLG
jgi:hypothetical protein